MVAVVVGRNRSVKVIDGAVGVCAAAAEVALVAGRNRSISLIDVACGVDAVVICEAWSRCLIRFGVWKMLSEGVGGFLFFEADARLEVLLGTGICIISGVYCNSK